MEADPDRVPQDVRSRSIDDFESVFRAAETPVIEVPPVAIERLLVIVEPQSGPETDSVAGVALQLAERFHPAVLCLTVVDEHEAPAPAQALLEGVEARLTAAASEVESKAERAVAADFFLEVIDTWVPSLILMPCPYFERGRSLRGYSLGATVDVVIRSRDVPTLLLKGPLKDPSSVFARPLLYLPSMADPAGQAALAFTLAPDGGQVHALHVVDDQFLRLDAEVVKLDPETDSESGVESYRRALQRQWQATLGGIAAAAEDRPFAVSYAVETGIPVAACRDALSRCNSTLLVVDTNVYSHDTVSSETYDLVRTLDETPILVT